MTSDEQANRTRIVILGAAGRDFHNFNVVYRDNPAFEVVAFTAAQIDNIAGRRYPRELAGELYPRGIPVIKEHSLESFRGRHRFDQVVFAYSDVTHAQVMHLASRALALGADFSLLGPAHTMLKASVPVIAVSAVRTGCGKSQTARWLSVLLRRHGLRIAVIRHPMPYGDLARQAVQRFATRVDIDAAGGADVRRVMQNVRRINARAAMVRGGSPVRLDAMGGEATVKGKRVLVIEDGPTTTHGGMAYGAGHVVALRAQAKEIVNPRPYATPEIAAVYAAYPHVGAVLPAMGYSPAQLAALAQTINATPADVVMSATPIDLAALIRVNKPIVRARYDYADIEDPGLAGIVVGYLRRAGLAAREE